jgi:ubiquinone/menaquinone biosynthesis C-methylase UbiE
VAAGNGNLAVIAAREGAAVVASDLTPRMLELGRQRSVAEGLEIEWVEADAEALPFEDGRFDCAASVFGAMFAPDHRRVASELFRVVRPGGTVGMANWTPTGFQAGFFEIMSRYGPPLPAGVEPASRWGDEQIVRERLDRLASSVTMEPRQIVWEFPSFEAMEEFFRSTSPRQAQIAQESGPAAMEAMMAGIAELVRRFNQKDDGSIRVEADYVLIVARKSG